MTERNPDPELEEFCERLKQLRRLAGISQSTLGKRADLSLDAVYRIESGQRAPNLGSVFRLARALGVTPAELLSDNTPRREGRPTPGLSRLVSLLEGQPKAVVKAVTKCAEAIVEL
jgi:transcriptional regulator with XRE-family HTH domain